jgi:methyl-accepting chemotaxis protein
MKIVHKLILLIVIGFMGSVFISVISFSRLTESNNNMRAIIDNTLPSFNALNSAHIDFLNFRILIRAHVIETDPAKMAVLEDKMKAVQDAGKKMLATYATLLSDAQDKANYDKLVASVADYDKQSLTTLGLSRNNQTADAAAALVVQAKIAEDVSAQFMNAIAYNEKLARDLDVAGKASFESAKWILIVSSLVSALLLFGIGWFIYSQISTGLKIAQTTITRIETTLDFTLRADVNGSDEISTMLRAFNQLIGRMQTNLRELLQGVEQVANSADRLQSSAHRVSEGSSSQNASTSHMAASVEEMTVSINHVADQANTTSEQSNEAGRKAEAGQQVIAHTVDNIHAIAGAVDNAAKDIQQLESKGREIESVINIIRAVAEQTNLLALNAAIEAARAGEQGRGFAVVADEVRSLAARTATSTKEISEIITAIQNVSASAVKRMQEAISKVEEGVEGASQANETMTEICRVSAESVTLVADISHAIREQGAATNSIAQQVENVAQMVDENTQAANETADLANDLSKISESMRKVVTAYRL